MFYTKLIEIIYNLNIIIIYALYKLVLLQSMEEKILEIVNEVHVKSAGKCGISAVKICEKLGVDYSEIKKPLNHLYDNDLIKVREGINSHLIFNADK